MLLLIISILIIIGYYIVNNFYFKTCGLVIKIWLMNNYNYYIFYNKKPLFNETDKKILIKYFIHNKEYVLTIKKTPIVMETNIFLDEYDSDITEIVETNAGPNFCHNITPKDLGLNFLKKMNENGVYIINGDDLIK